MNLQSKNKCNITANGQIRDNRPKPCENKVVEFDGEKFKLVKYEHNSTTNQMGF